MKKYIIPLLMLIIFESIAITLYITTKNIFYLFNFSYIGICLSFGIFLYIRKVKYARNMIQFAVGSYMLIYLGVFNLENMQIEGFWYYLFLGVFEAALIHYFVAKILGPLFFGRGWCGYACWTAMILDLLPFKEPKNPRKKIKFMPYIIFISSFLYVGGLFILKFDNLESIMLWSFILGNLIYYSIGVYLAYNFFDNRSFCKYICPVTVFLKPASYFSLIRVKNDLSKCIGCNKCKKVCPMDVDVVNNSRNRENGTDCILCLKCIEECPKQSLYI
ncbi:MAG TPA: 4Fe-4S dicluster domain-containing protein [Clostridiales bacterium]|nr:4Fe-4S dicluster domain-containing protein [Clostridiales bacterium]